MADAVAPEQTTQNVLINPSQSGPAAPTQPKPEAPKVEGQEQQQAPANPQGEQQPAPNGQEQQVAAPEVVPSLTEKEPEKQIAISETDDAGVVTYEETGIPGLDLALAFVGKLGIAGDDPAMLAAAAGQFDLIKARLATLGAPAQGWEQHVALAEKAYNERIAENQKFVKSIHDAVHGAVGGAENWTSILAWAKQNADPSEAAAINAMFDAGPIQAKAAAQMLLGAYQAAAGTVVTPHRATAPNAGAAAPDSAKLLTRAEYGNEARALYAKMGNRMDGSAELADLRRRAGFRA